MRAKQFMGWSIRAVAWAPGSNALFFLFAMSLQHQEAFWEAHTWHSASLGHPETQQPSSLQILHYYVSHRHLTLVSGIHITSQILPPRPTRAPGKVRELELHTFHSSPVEINQRLSFINTEFVFSPWRCRTHEASRQLPRTPSSSSSLSLWENLSLSWIIQAEPTNTHNQHPTSIPHKAPAPWLHCSMSDTPAGLTQQQLPRRLHQLEQLIDNSNFRHLQFWKINKQSIREA